MKRLTIYIAAVILAALSPQIHAQSISTKETLSITIKGVPQTEQSRISSEYVVSPDGYIYLPHISGGLRASGMSSSALARKIEAAYRSAEIYTNPRITVISRKDAAQGNIEAQMVTVGGFVKSPGPKQFMRGMSLFQAISAAGGESTFGSIRRVELLRNGKRYVYDLRKTSHKGVKVFPGDSINVPQKTAFGG